MKPHVLITGATKGIGRACAERFARAGYAVTAVARTATDLTAMEEFWRENFPNGVLRTVAADLSRPEAIDQIPVAAYTVVVLNAATFSPGNLLNGPDRLQALLPLNVLANHRLARRLLPGMMARGAGHLLVIGSTGTDNWKEHMTAYVATKYALRGLFLGWQAELRGSGVRATLLAPGATLTASWDDEVPPPDILHPHEVAEAAWEAIERGREGRIIVTRGAVPRSGSTSSGSLPTSVAGANAGAKKG